MAKSKTNLGPKLVTLQKDPYRVHRGAEVRINLSGNDCLEGFYAGLNEFNDLVTSRTFFADNILLPGGGVSTEYHLLNSPAYVNLHAVNFVEALPGGTLEKRVESTSKSPLVRGKPNGS